MSSSNSDDPLPSYQKIFRKRRVIFGGIILVLIGGLFFSFGDEKVSAGDDNDKRIEKIDVQSIDPMSRVGTGFLVNKCENPNSLCGGLDKAEDLGAGDEKIADLVKGYPISEMVPYISQRDSRVAHFLVAIAKKESDWGNHTPKKDGKECWNFWGYRGPENTTDSGYSCFDSPNEAVAVVGDRIERLINLHIDTPEKMVVWKCGGSCMATGGMIAARKWISDVSACYAKMNS